MVERIIFQIKIDTESDVISYAKDSMGYIESMAFETFIKHYAKMLEMQGVIDMDNNTQDME